jgi:hypothetical protein
MAEANSKGKKITNRSLAKAAGITPNTISNWRVKNPLWWEQLMALFEQLDLEVT